MKAALILEDGSVFHGESMGATADCICEMVFNTSMVGYQEILTDPSCAGQGVVMTYPLIGNYGVNSEDEESRKPWAAALIVRRLSPRGSNFRNEGTLGDYLTSHNITGICGVDTRAVARLLRDKGAMNGMITVEEAPNVEEKLEAIRACRGSGAVERVTRQTAEDFPGEGPRVALLDLGVRESMIRGLRSRGCGVTVFPAHTPAETILSGGFDGVMLSGGPGDPADNREIIEEVRRVCDAELPVFGVGLGHQLMALAMGFSTEKLRCGHRGANHPVRDTSDGRVYITSQNHGYAVKADSVRADVAEISHVGVNDGSVEGLRYKNGAAFTVQFEPDVTSGAWGTGHLLDEFVEKMEGKKHAEK